jgi:hypothetical protein
MSTNLASLLSKRNSLLTNLKVGPAHENDESGLKSFTTIVLSVKDYGCLN